jgi:uncharacterized repeat protein (TIGR02543 family)
MIQNRNEFRIIFQDETEKKHLAYSLKQAAQDYDTPDNPITQVTRTRVGVTVDIPDPVVIVDFETTVTPEGAVSAGCIATPSKYAVRSGTPVVFEAIAADGYTFDGWFQETTALGTSAISEITVTGDGRTPAAYTAKFSAVE